MKYVQYIIYIVEVATPCGEEQKSGVSAFLTCTTCSIYVFCHCMLSAYLLAVPLLPRSSSVHVMKVCQSVGSVLPSAHRHSSGVLQLPGASVQ